MGFLKYSANKLCRPERGVLSVVFQNKQTHKPPCLLLLVNPRGSSTSAQGGNGDAHPSRVRLENEAEIFLDLNRELEAGSFTVSAMWATADLYDKIVSEHVHGHSASRAGGDVQGDVPQTYALRFPTSAEWAGRVLIPFLPRTLINLLNEFIPSECVPENCYLKHHPKESHN